MASLPLFEASLPGAKLVGIAGIAAASESLREGHDVEYFTLGARSLLSRVVSNRNLLFNWATGDANSPASIATRVIPTN